MILSPNHTITKHCWRVPGRCCVERRSPRRVRPRFLYRDPYLTIDLEAHRVYVHEQPVQLTPYEFRLLVYLVQSAGQVCTYADILENVWGWDGEESSAQIQVYISHLRHKIEPDPQKSSLHHHGSPLRLSFRTCPLKPPGSEKIFKNPSKLFLIFPIRYFQQEIQRQILTNPNQRRAMVARTPSLTRRAAGSNRPAYAALRIPLSRSRSRSTAGPPAGHIAPPSVAARLGVSIEHPPPPGAVDAVGNWYAGTWRQCARPFRRQRDRFGCSCS